jgi:hypothetical protein
MKRMLFLLLTALLPVLAAKGQQVPDTGYAPLIPNPAYAPAKGPVVYIDEGHHNFHTRGDRYLPFVRLLERDGYVTEGYTGKFDAAGLEKCRILVISNALNELNVENWFKPVYPAFTPEETEAVRRWVEAGGSLFLIADHMPMGGAAAGMAAAFGFGFTDGFAVDTALPGPALFRRTDGTLRDNVLTGGRRADEKVDSIYSFTGQAFTIPADTQSVLSFNDRYLLLLSDTAWVFNEKTVYRPIRGWSQLAYKEYGKGRVVMSGEAAMFSAQLAGPQKFPAGMNAPYARHNYRLLLNIIHWLDGR